MLVRRHLTLALALGLLVALSACGGDVVTARGDADARPGFEAVDVSGEADKAPEVEWRAPMEADEVEVETLVEGDGDEIVEDDQVLIHLTVENGFTQERTFTTYGKNGAAQSVAVDKDTLPAFRDAIIGQRVGSRVALVGPAGEGFGPTGNANLGIGNADPFLLVVDIKSKVLEGPEGERSPSPAWAPKVVHQKGKPARLDFGGVSEPSGALQQAVLVEGTGPAVRKGDSVVVNYLGQVRGKKQPFDESYGREPLTTPVGRGAVVKGWDQGLVGKTVGSRVLLAVPPHLGYGEEGRGEDISGTDTMYFVIDILGAG